MDKFEIEELDERSMLSIAVEFKKEDNSADVVKWVLDQFMSQGQTLILLHIRYISGHDV